MFYLNLFAFLFFTRTPDLIGSGQSCTIQHFVQKNRNCNYLTCPFADQHAWGCQHWPRQGPAHEQISKHRPQPRLPIPGAAVDDVLCPLFLLVSSMENFKGQWSSAHIILSRPKP